jgi:Fe-S cluster biogenesis protein NfuA
MTDAKEFQSQLQRLDTLLREGGPAAEHTRTVVSALLDLHGAGLTRLLEHVAEADGVGASILDACARDEVVGGLLLLHGLHPTSLEDRVLQALDAVRPALRAHGGNVEMLEVDGGVVRLRLEGNCHGCPSSAATMKQTIEEAIVARAPDAEAIEVEGVADGVAETGDLARLALPLV